MYACTCHKSTHAHIHGTHTRLHVCLQLWLRTRSAISQWYSQACIKDGEIPTHLGRLWASNTVPNLHIWNISLQVRLCACASGTGEHEAVSALCVCACATRQDLTARACVYMFALLVKTWVQRRMLASLCIWSRYPSRLDCKSVCLPLCVYARAPLVKTWLQERLCVCACATRQDLTARASVCLSVCMRVRHSSRLECKSVCLPLCVNALALLDKTWMQEPLFGRACATCQGLPASASVCMRATLPCKGPSCNY